MQCFGGGEGQPGAPEYSPMSASRYACPELTLNNGVCPEGYVLKLKPVGAVKSTLYVPGKTLVKL